MNEGCVTIVNRPKEQAERMPVTTCIPATTKQADLREGDTGRNHTCGHLNLRGMNSWFYRPEADNPCLSP